jgi:Arc/MetJ-type ribon-helix-helix transcriptional regulator
MTKATAKRKPRRPGARRKPKSQRAVKVAVSLTPEQLRRVRQAVADGRAESVSAYVASALDRSHADAELSALLDQLDAEYGSPAPDVLDRLDAAFARAQERR